MAASSGGLRSGRWRMKCTSIQLADSPEGTPVPHAGSGSEVTLWGHGPAGTLLAIDDVAHAAGTIGYELMCAVAPRVAVRIAP